MLRVSEEPKQELNTWKEVAAYLGVSIRTAQNYEQDEGLPVRRMPGAKGRVVAYPEELGRWKADRLTVREAKNGHGRPPSDAEPGKPSPAPETIAPESGEQAAPPQTEPVARNTVFRRRLFVGLAAIAAAILVLGLAIHWLLPSRPPVAYRIEVSTLIALDGQGKEIWRHQFPKPFLAKLYDPEAEYYSLATFDDLDGDGQVEMLFAYSPMDYTSVGSTVYCFSQGGKERWHFTPGRPVVNDGNGDHFPPYLVAAVMVFKNPGEPARIAVSSIHNIAAPDQLAILDSQGRITGEYWHPGHIKYMAHADLNGDGKQELLIAGVNNGDHAATMLVFDPGDVSGACLNVKDKRFELKGFRPGSQKARVLFPRSCIGLREPYNRVGHFRATENRIYAEVTEGVAETNPRKIIYELDFGLKVLSAMPTVQTQAAHRELEEAGKVDHSFAKEIPELPGRVVVIRR